MFSPAWNLNRQKTVCARGPKDYVLPFSIIPFETWFSNGIFSMVWRLFWVLMVYVLKAESGALVGSLRVTNSSISSRNSDSIGAGPSAILGSFYRSLALPRRYSTKDLGSVYPGARLHTWNLINLKTKLILNIPVSISYQAFCAVISRFR